MPPKPETDDARRGPEIELLAVRCQLGESDAFDELVERWHVPLWRFVRRLAQDDATAEEILQDAWLRIVQALPGLRRPSRLVPWIFRIARHAAIDRLRAGYARRESLGEPADLDLEALEDDADASHVGLSDLPEEIDRLQRQLLELPLIEREVLTLFYLRELNLREVADVLEIPTGTVKSRLHRARKMLRERIRDSEPTTI